MDGIKKIIVVLANKNDFHLIPTFESINQFTWEIVFLGKADDLNHLKTSIAVKIYEHVAEMPGYLRGLTDDLVSADLIIAVNPLSLSCFQALRASRKWKKPFGVISNLSYFPILSDSSQEAFMMKEVLSHSQFVLTMHQTAKELLELEGVKNIKNVKPQFAKGSGFCLKKRAKFRSYIGVKDDEFLILTLIGQDELAGRDVMLACKSLLQKHTDIAPFLKILICYEGNLPNLRYLASDMGVARQVLLLNQNLDGFFQDLASAVDAVYDGNPSSQKHYIPTAMEIMAHGAKGIYLRGTVLAEHMPDGAIAVPSSSFQDLAAAFQKAYSMRLPSFTSRCSKDYRSNFSCDLDGISRILKEAMDQGPHELAASSLDICTKWQLVAACKEIRKYKEAMDLLKEILKMTDADEQMSRAYFELGSLDFISGDIASAIDHLGLAVKYDPNYWQAYLVLAKVSLVSHSEEDAVAFYKRVLALKPHQPEALAGVGTVYRMLYMPEDALYWLNQSLTVDPSNEKVLLELTQACLECESFNEPIEILENLQLLMGDVTCLIMALGQLYLKSGNWEQGRAMVAKALESDQARSIKLLPAHG